MNAIDRQDVQITTLGYGGEGIAKKGGFVLFVPRGLPGDSLRVQVRKRRKRYGSAVIESVLSPSSSRVPPKCVDFDRGCGGCQWLHFDYHEQLFHKAKLLRDSLKRIAKLSVKVSPALPARPNHGCRNKLSVTRDRSGRIGLCVENTRTVLELADCRMELPSNLRVYRELADMPLPDDVTQIHIRSNTAGETGVCFYSESFGDEYQELAKQLQAGVASVRSVGVKTRGDYVHVVGDRGLTQQIGRLTYEIPTNCFFQSNYAQAEALRDLVAASVSSDGCGKLLDLYCGVGFFSLELAATCNSVVGVEYDAEAVRAARSNARANGVQNARFEVADSGRYLARVKKKGEFDTVVLDPPRAGVQPMALRSLIAAGPRRIVYVSCAPDTLARDLRVLVDEGYHVRDCVPVDMFPQTYHVECVARLEKRT